jgi:hypothetical protein
MNFVANNGVYLVVRVAFWIVYADGNGERMRLDAFGSRAQRALTLRNQPLVRRAAYRR